MSVSTLITCPFCGEMNARFESIRAAFKVQGDVLGAAPNNAKWGALGTCYHCKNSAVLYFDIAPNITFPTGNNVDLNKDPRFAVIGTRPSRQSANIPENIPTHLLEDLKSADAVFQAHQYKLAAIGYGMLLDAALTEICEPKAVVGKMIGEKLGVAKQLGRISPQIADLLEGANSVRTIGTHYAESVSKQDASIARELIVAALENIFSYPAKVKAMSSRLNALRN